MDRNDRTERDAAGIGPYARERDALTPLSTLDDWTIPDGEPDIRGWDVRTISGRQLGSVADLLVDVDAAEVVMLDVDLPGSDRHTFVPIRVAQIDRGRRLVLMDSADVPDADVARGADTRIADRRSRDARVVRYPTTDREVTDRAVLADGPAVPLADQRAATARARDTERRRGDRRRIERISTDL
jgi:hypothetical protein